MYTKKEGNKEDSERRVEYKKKVGSEKINVKDQRNGNTRKRREREREDKERNL